MATSVSVFLERMRKSRLGKMLTKSKEVKLESELQRIEDDLIAKLDEEIGKYVNTSIQGGSLSMSTGPSTPISTPTPTAAAMAASMSAITTAAYGATYTNPYNSQIYATTNLSSSYPGVICSKHEITLNTSVGPIVKIDSNGEIYWTHVKNKEEEAVRAFEGAFRIGVEFASGMTESVKRNMRDVVFEEIIELAKESGPLDATQLQLLHKSAKIMDKLKGKF